VHTQLNQCVEPAEKGKVFLALSPCLLDLLNVPYSANLTNSQTSKRRKEERKKKKGGKKKKKRELVVYFTPALFSAANGPVSMASYAWYHKGKKKKKGKKKGERISQATLTIYPVFPPTKQLIILTSEDKRNTDRGGGKKRGERGGKEGSHKNAAQSPCPEVYFKTS